MLKYFENNISIIQSSRKLTFYGAALSLIFVFQSAYWWIYGFAEKLTIDQASVCWPFFRSCSSIRFFNPIDYKVFFIVLAFLGLITSILFILKKVKTAFLLLLISEIASVLFILIDYRLRLNQNIMIFFVVSAYLFSLNKLRYMRLIIVLFYFFAGLLKLNPEWLSGEAIYGSLWLIPDSFKPLAAKYVVFLELFLIWFLLLSKRFKAIILTQLFLFHLVSLGVVGFYYPTLMLLILSLFVFDIFENTEKTNNFKFDFAGVSIVSILILFNGMPHFLGRDNSITGESRILSLHMFDTITICNSSATLHYTGKSPIKIDLYMPNVVRIRCDPVVFLSRVRQLCAIHAEDPDFDDIDWQLEVKKKHEVQSSFKQIVNIKKFCSQNIEYNLLLKNNWIEID